MQPEYLGTFLPSDLEPADLLPDWSLERLDTPLGAYGYCWDLRLEALLDGEDKTYVMWARSDPSVTMSVTDVLVALEEALKSLKADLSERGRRGEA